MNELALREPQKQALVKAKEKVEEMKESGDVKYAKAVMNLSEQARLMALERVAKQPAKQNVLPEQDYVEVMTHIIRRDFFPELHLTLGGDEAEEGDPMRKKKRPKSRRRRQRGNTWEGNSSDEDESADGDSDDEERDLSRLRTLKKLSINAFAKKFTSEDNASFSEILANDQKASAEKKSWIYEQKVLDDMQRAILAGPDDDNKKGMLRFWDYKAKNKLFFDREIEGHSAIAAALAELKQKHNKVPSVVHENTRIPADLRLAIPTDKAPFATHKMTAQRSLTGPGTPQVGGHKFVYTPNVNSGEQVPATWGNLLATPVIVDQDGEERRFTIGEVPYRDKLMLKLNKKNAERIQKEKFGKRVRTPASILRDMTTPATLGNKSPSGFRRPSRISAAKMAARRRAKKLKTISALSPAARRLLGGGTPSIFSSPRSQLRSPSLGGLRSRSLSRNPIVETPSPSAARTPGSVPRDSRHSVSRSRSRSRSRTPLVRPPVAQRNRSTTHEVLAVKMPTPARKERRAPSSSRSKKRKRERDLYAPPRSAPKPKKKGLTDGLL